MAERTNSPASRAQSGPRIPLGRAYDTLDTLQALLREVPGVSRTSPVGLVRRGLDLVEEVELIVVTDLPARVNDALASLDDSVNLSTDGDHQFTLELERVHATVRCIVEERAGSALVHHTGSGSHLSALRARAAHRGGSLERTGLHRSGAPTVSATEEAIYDALDLPFIAPELREGGDELIAAERGELPQLVTAADIRGDLHMHSLWSDGRDAIEAMVLSAIGLGYEYIAITDHSPNSAASRSLTLDGVARQADEIASLRDSYPQVAILHGCEADILGDGSLDFPDTVLERFDIVLASLHERLDHNAGTLLQRYARAMRHPLVSLITHPTNRVIPYRAGYELDYDRLFALAVETGTLLEIDGGPSHLDLDAPLARRAVKAGVELAVDSDCHLAHRLGRQMHLGLVTARRGWVEARQVLNTRPLSEVRARIAAKRVSSLG